MSGYDGRGTIRYHRMMCQQHRYYKKRFKIPMSIGPFNKNIRPQSHFSHFTVEAEWPEGNSITNCYVSDWQMEIQNDAKRPYFQRILRFLYSYLKFCISGCFWPIFTRQIWAAIAFSVPTAGLLARLLLLSLFVLPAIALIRAFELNLTIGIIIGLMLIYPFLLAYARVSRYFKSLYEQLLADAFILFRRYADNDTRKVEAQAATFSREMIDLIDQERPDEVFIIGHSGGCFHALPVHKAVLEARRSGSGHKNYDILQVTLGSLVPYGMVHKKSYYFRTLATQMLEDSDTHWIEYFAPHDPYSTPYINLGKDYGFNLSTPIPARYEVRSALYGKVFSKRKIRLFKFNPLRMHFQYFMANDVAGSYDFFYILTNPNALKNNLNPLAENAD